jgi:hypothetical protein
VKHTETSETTNLDVALRHFAIFLLTKKQGNKNKILLTQK